MRGLKVSLTDMPLSDPFCSSIRAHPFAHALMLLSQVHVGRQLHIMSSQNVVVKDCNMCLAAVPDSGALLHAHKSSQLTGTCSSVQPGSSALHFKVQTS